MKIKQKKNKPELLAPAGNFEKLETAVYYGADAVYLGGQDFSLRNFSGNFSDKELVNAIKFAHSKNVKVYITCNIYSKNHEQKPIIEFFNKINKIKPDAVIIADPGLIFLAKKNIPNIDIHLSTQSNTTNYNAVMFWKELGIKRINLARELSLKEIKEIALSSLMEIETFIHGAMCISYSGRCLLSNFLSMRGSNQGLCTHPCRWKYSVVEEQRPGKYHSIMEDKKGTYIFNSKDLCMIEHIPELINAGITSFKIEGRMKGINYLAGAVKTYKQAISSYINEPDNYFVKPEWKNEFAQIFHRDYSTGFYFNTPDKIVSNYLDKRTGKIHSFLGKIIKIKKENKIVVNIKNKVSIGDIIEVLTFSGPALKSKVLNIFDKNKNPIKHAQPNTCSTLQLEIKCAENQVVRKIS